MERDTLETAEQISPQELVPIPSPHVEPRLVNQGCEPRRVNALTLLEGKTFLSTTLSGDIAPAASTDVGLFHQDTRFLSYLELRVNGHRTVVLSSSTHANLISQIELTATNVVVRENFDSPDNTVHVRREQLLSGCFLDRLSLENFNLQPVDIQLEWLFDADFADVFQVRGMLRNHTGQYFKPILRGSTVHFAYRGLDDAFRQTTLHFDPAPDDLTPSCACYKLTLQPQEKRQLLLTVRPWVEGRSPVLVSPEFNRCLDARREAFHDWVREATSFESSNETFDQCMASAVSDFYALRVPFELRERGGEEHIQKVEAGAELQQRSYSGEIIAAGIPWFATIFGRDSLIAGYQSLLLQPNLATQTLRFLAHYQGTEINDWRDEQPGKILHELREGEMTRAGEMPHSPYYGSVDSTPLFLILLNEAYNWTGDEVLLHDLLPNARRALDWIHHYGDLDGDGFVEFLRRAPRGLANQGWKDSWDANLLRDGTLAEPPIALCEVQGYCFDALYRMARLLRGHGETAEAEKARRAAADLAHRFEHSFWMPDENFYAMSLDRNKRQQQVIASNAGHLLWSRIIPKDRARLVAARLMRSDMFSGWGLRTLSADESTFNPLSYHRGSVWPHDNSLTAMGLAFFEMKQPLLRIFTGLFQAATHFRNLRLPELFVGAQRRQFDEPVHYPVSCSPQAWASGSLFLMLTAMLGIRPSAPRRELRIVDPVLPEWLSWLRIRNLRVGRSRVTLEFSRRETRTFCNVLDVQGDRLSVSVDFRKGGAE